MRSSEVPCVESAIESTIAECCAGSLVGAVKLLVALAPGLILLLNRFAVGLGRVLIGIALYAIGVALVTIGIVLRIALVMIGITLVFAWLRIAGVGGMLLILPRC